MKKSVLIILGLIATIFIIQSFTVEPAIEQESEFKNLQVLPKNISKSDLDNVMRTFTRSLDVKCSFCHAPSDEPGKLDFASDVKFEKKISRGMMSMSIEINKNYFAPHGEGDPNNVLAKDTSDAKFLFSHITCYTCHHGNAHPINTPPMPNWKNK